MIIVSAADERFVPHFATMLHSAWFHNRMAEFYLLDCGIEPETRETLSAFAAVHDIRLTIAQADMARLRDLPTRPGEGAAAYARLLIADILPVSCERAIYLDSDCVVTSDLSELWEIDISNCLIAAVEDGSARKFEIRKHGLQGHADYVNSGVMLINLRSWREEKAAQSILAHIRRNPLLAHLDQTAINAVAAGRIETISDSWNFMHSHLSSMRDPPPRPCVIHYAGPCRPWLHSDAMFAPVYLFHRNSTPYPIEAPTKRYRSRFRIAVNLILLRRKYRRRQILSRHYHRIFTIPHLKAISGQLPQTLKAARR